MKVFRCKRCGCLWTHDADGKLERIGGSQQEKCDPTGPLPLEPMGDAIVASFRCENGHEQSIVYLAIRN